MGRRSDSSVAEAVFGIAAALPWWVGVALAVIAYGVLHRFAVAPVPAAAVPGQVGQMVVSQVMHMFAYYGQYVVPLLLLAGAVASYLGRRRRQTLFFATRSAAAIRAMDWREFELLVGEAFRMRGYAVAETGGAGADGGIDLVLRKNGELFLVQCKHWRAYKVPVMVVRELYGVMAARGAAGGFVVTSGVFTAEAKDFAAGRNIELIEANALAEMIHRARASVPPRKRMLVASATSEKDPDTPPRCPHCGGEMVKRTGKKGSHGGSTFWGCKAYPACRGARPSAS